MESSGNYHILSKFTRLRKKPQQPLSDLTELYGKIANESIFYLKLEEQKNYKGALQGWKALSTDVMYRLTLIEHEYPNVQSYTREELNIKSGLRELYNKSLDHLDRIKALYEEDQEKSNSSSSRTSSMNNRTIPENRKPLSYRQPPTFRKGLPSSSRKMVTTLRDPKLKASRNFNQSSSYDLRPKAPKDQSYNKVNFTPSKPLVKTNTALPDDKNSFDGFDDDLELIDLTQDSEEEERYVQDTLTSPKSDQFEFDVEDYYGTLLDESASDEDVNDLERHVTNFSINSSPLLPVHKLSVSEPELPAHKAPEIPGPAPSEIVKGRPPIPTTLPPSLAQQTSSTTIRPSKSGDDDTKSSHGSSLNLYKSNNTTSSVIVNSRKIKSAPKPTSASQLKSTKSTPALTVRQKTVSPLPPAKVNAAKSNIRGTQAVKTETKRTIASGFDQTRKTASKRPSQAVQNSHSKNPQQQPSAGNHPLGTKGKKAISQSTPLKGAQVSKNGKANSMNSIISTASNNNSAGNIREVSTPTVETISLKEGPQKDPELNEKELKAILEDEIIDSLQGVDRAAAKQIFAEIVVHGDEVHWEDIAGLESAKSSLKEAVVYPFLRPDLFRGLREPVRGMLLFGPPGTGKTMLARAVATESHSTFFSISASSLTSKYLGESEKLVRALFAVAKKLSPSIVFVDEIDSIMGSRNNEGENESSRRIKNEFLIQWSSLSSAAAGNTQVEDDERVLVLAATNLPWSIDEAARRRFVRRQYIPLPEPETRSVQLKKLLSYQKHTLMDEDFIELLGLTEGFSGSDLTSLAKDAAMGPLRELGDKLLSTPTDLIRPINLIDFRSSLNYIKPSVSQEGLEKYETWASKFGSSGV